MASAPKILGYGIGKNGSMVIYIYSSTGDGKTYIEESDTILIPVRGFDAHEDNSVQREKQDTLPLGGERGNNTARSRGLGGKTVKRKTKSRRRVSRKNA